MSVQYYKRFQIVVGIVLKISRTIVCYDPPPQKKKKSRYITGYFDQISCEKQYYSLKIPLPTL